MIVLDKNVAWPNSNNMMHSKYLCHSRRVQHLYRNIADFFYPIINSYHFQL